MDLTLLVSVKSAFIGCSMLPGHGLCDSVCKSLTLAHATNNTDVISAECRALMRSVPFHPSDLRGVRFNTMLFP